ncbi:polysaccharide biosynthesis protein [Paenibacillus sp.]|uniref:putative polysaccharide biosynthesis protein n=1 Tax=Paenibacillus sp. TaxID=58172 RepID=UPI002D5B7619|nr:polysaccharide biosynthesis protein [Paenibacillus sp.]HZG84619.1 polysaccharide biosynthesis protein [Paenibacillus sp.]
MKGTLILAGAALVARVLGVVQRIPLQRLLDDAGMATYVTSYNVYMWLLVLATAGFPSAIAKLVSEKYAIGRPDEGEAIRRAALRYSLAAGVCATALVYALAPALAALNEDPNATLAIRALAPALLLFPWIAVERGYFHGRQRMGANGLSQVWEQMFRVVTSIVFAYALLELGFGLAWAAAGASFGGVLGAVAAAVVMLVYGAKLRREEAAPARAAAAGGGSDAVAVPMTATLTPEGGVSANAAATADVSSFRAIFRAILKLSIPVSVTALAVPTVYLIDSLVTKPMLTPAFGADLAQEMQGWLTGRAQALAGIPVIFAIALSQSILPIISSAFIRGEREEVERQTGLALRMTLLSGVPVACVLAVSSFSLNTFVFKDAEGSWVIAAMVATVLFQVVMMTSGSILLGLGKPALPMRHIALGVALKLVLSLALAPLFGIYGIVAGTAACFALTMALNLRALRGLVAYSVFGGRVAPFAVTAAAQAAVGAAIGWASYEYVHPFGVTFWDAFVQTALTAGAAAALYPALLLRTGAFKAEDAAALPPKARRLWERAEPTLRRLRLVR